MCQASTCGWVLAQAQVQVLQNSESQIVMLRFTTLVSARLPLTKSKWLNFFSPTIDHFSPSQPCFLKIPEHCHVLIIRSHTCADRHMLQHSLLRWWSRNYQWRCLVSWCTRDAALSIRLVLTQYFRMLWTSNNRTIHLSENTIYFSLLKLVSQTAARLACVVPELCIIRRLCTVCAASRSTSLQVSLMTAALLVFKVLVVAPSTSWRRR